MTRPITIVGHKLIQLEKIQRKNTVDSIAQQLRDHILAGRIEPGNTLPPERQMAASLGVNRLTLRQALARLDAVGLVKARHGSGTVVLDYRRTAGLGLLGDLMAARRDSGSFPVDLLRDLLLVRRLLAAEVVGLAAEHRTNQDLVELRSLADAQLGRTADPRAFAHGDLEFVRALVRSCRNVAMELLFNAVAAFVEAHPGVAEAMYAEPADSAGQYGAVLLLVESRAGAQARTLVRAVLEGLDQKTLQRFAAGFRKGGEA